MSKLQTPALLDFRWGTSRGRDTYGYNICSLYVDGRKVASCNGGGYDMAGTSLGEWIAKQFQEELKPLADKASSRYQYKDGTRELVDISPESDGRYRPDDQFYGMYAYLKEDGQVDHVSIDGACGQQSVERILKALGYGLQYKGKLRGGGSSYILVEQVPA